MRTVVLSICLLLLAGIAAQAQGFLHTQGQDMVDESGQKILLQGVGLGNWLLPEGYMWKFGENGDRPRKIEKLVSDLIGQEKADQFWLEFRKNYITEADIQRIAELGYNSVRPALNARRFLTEDENPVFVEEGFQLLDNLIQWCKKYNIYVIIDMHGAPGGQTGQNIDDSPADEPGLFRDEKFEERLIRLWARIAEIYKDEPAVAAYDLLNEPLPKRTGADKYNNLLEPLYKKITEAIRKIDSKHMITLEGADWANDWSVFSAPFDKNVFYQFHFYCWDRPDHLNNIDKFITRREQLNAPVWVGETGEKDNAIYWGTMQYFEANNIGWSFWPWKKMDTVNTPYSIKKPEGWDAIVQYSRGGTKPDTALAQKAKNYRTEEPVPVETIEAAQSQGRRWNSEQCIKLQEGEWTTYDIHSLESKTVSAKIKLKTDTLPASFVFTINGQEKKVEITETGWREISLDKAEFKKDWNTVKILVTGKSVDIDWMEFD